MTEPVDLRAGASVLMTYEQAKSRSEAVVEGRVKTISTDADACIEVTEADTPRVEEGDRLEVYQAGHVKLNGSFIGSWSSIEDSDTETNTLARGDDSDQ